MTARILLRPDASRACGAGHLMRCLTLADALAQKGWEAHFACHEADGFDHGVVVRRGHVLHTLPAYQGWEADAVAVAPLVDRLKPDWLIVDHYGLDARWEQACGQPPARVAVIDDLADRPHAGAVLFDSGIHRQADAYDGLVPAHCRRFCGPAYALLRPAFAAHRQVSLRRRAAGGKPARLMLAMGGVDADNVTGAVLEVIAPVLAGRGMALDVVLGSNAPHRASVTRFLEKAAFAARLHVDLPDLAGLMADSDIAIGASGGTALERLCLGLPSLVLSLADNQPPAAQAIMDLGAGLYAGDVREAGWQQRLLAGLSGWLDDPAALKPVPARAAALVDGEGAHRVAEVLHERG
ncbi:MAG: UDP-2,4-diacetamido-2,4,6-trideoxy-beta-L-altropyranose hydrolase [Caulobacterales bacterium]|uniref:UDP-2,4-diacetamido-2,4, 6-trideoxy-beta-L-altropyranose hydrolase n=1 Tax=Glycocaulis sp. TaxID=1969725 RepID=UPI003F9FB1FC